MDVEFMMRPPPFDEKRCIGKGKKFPSDSYDFQVLGLDSYCEQKLSQIILTKISSQIEK
jgi:hypothetical protein